jgi:glycosyltransferase involved in cell wall biosynthesis
VTDRATPTPATPLHGRPSRRFVIVVRADPVICGHSVEARNLAEAALERGYDDVRIITWSLDRLEEVGLPLKPSVAPYSPGIAVERPEPVGGYKIPDARHTTGIVGRLVELFTDGVPTTCMSLYLLPHAMVVQEALASARATGLPVRVTTIAEAVGSDITDIARTALSEGRLGVAAHLFATYLANDHCVAVSAYTRDLVVEAAEQVDALLGTRFAGRCRQRIAVSYPAIDTSAYLLRDPEETSAAVAARGLEEGRYVLFLSRLARAKGVDDLVRGYAASAAHAAGLPLVVAGNGPEAGTLAALVTELGIDTDVRFLHDVDDAEKPHLLAGAGCYVLPTKPRPEFVETFGIAPAEALLAGAGPVVTTSTGGVPEAVGDVAVRVDTDAPGQIAAAIDEVLAMPPAERAVWRERGRRHASQFDRAAVLDALLGRVEVADEELALPA